MGCARAAHDVILRAYCRSRVTLCPRTGPGGVPDVFWPHVVCACVYELAESKYTVPHITPKRTFAATHISDRSNFLTRFLSHMSV